MKGTAVSLLKTVFLFGSSTVVSRHLYARFNEIYALCIILFNAAVICRSAGSSGTDTNKHMGCHARYMQIHVCLCVDYLVLFSWFKIIRDSENC